MAQRKPSQQCHRRRICPHRRGPCSGGSLLDFDPLEPAVIQEDSRDLPLNGQASAVVGSGSFADALIAFAKPLWDPRAHGIRNEIIEEVEKGGRNMSP